MLSDQLISDANFVAGQDFSALQQKLLLQYKMDRIEYRMVTGRESADDLQVKGKFILKKSFLGAGKNRSGNYAFK